MLKQSENGWRPSDKILPVKSFWYLLPQKYLFHRRRQHFQERPHPSPLSPAAMRGLLNTHRYLNFRQLVTHYIFSCFRSSLTAWNRMSSQICGYNLYLSFGFGAVKNLIGLSLEQMIEPKPKLKPKKKGYECSCG